MRKIQLACAMVLHDKVDGGSYTKCYCAALVTVAHKHIVHLFLPLQMSEASWGVARVLVRPRREMRVVNRHERAQVPAVGNGTLSVCVHVALMLSGLVNREVGCTYLCSK